jgi:hypothetical protein
MAEDNNHNDSLERFFRKKADDFDIPFQEEDWMKLEKQLDIRDLKRAYRNKVRWIAAAAILIISLLGYFTYENHNRLNQIADLMDREEIPEMEVVQPDENLFTEEMEEDIATADSELDLPEPESDPAVSPDNLAALPEETVKEVTAVTEYRGEDRMMRKPLIAGHYRLFDPEYGVRVIEGRYAEFLKTKADGLPPEDVLPEESAASRLYANADPKGNDVLPKYSRFSLSLAASPDVSSAGLISDMNNPGYKIGIMGEYRLSENVSVTSGLIASNVRYVVAGTDYSPPEYWNSGIVPDETRAVCFILDVPLNVKYNVFNFESSRLFATAGLSSYIMLNEDYRFRYDQAAYGAERSVNVRNGSTHWLSNAGFSIGYELDVHPDWSLRAEPFIKVPLRGVGWGDVNLYSAGSFISINYRL